MHEKDEKEKKRIKDSIEKYKQQVRSHDPHASMGQVRSKKKQLQKIGGPQIIQGLLYLLIKILVCLCLFALSYRHTCHSVGRGMGLGR
jgi:hypothetical protein